MAYALCINESERFQQVKRNYDGNLPPVVKELFYPLLDPKGTRLQLKRLDYGSEGVSLTKQEVINALQYNLTHDIVLPWHLTHCKETLEFVLKQTADSFMYVVYES